MKHADFSLSHYFPPLFQPEIKPASAPDPQAWRPSWEGGEAYSQLDDGIQTLN